jgi:hypothetical protein
MSEEKIVFPLFVENEGDMEFGIEYAYEIARSQKGPREVNMIFPSSGLADIFLTNLFEKFIFNEVPHNHGLNLIVHIPEDQIYD